jgi:hypothetical protein
MDDTIKAILVDIARKMVEEADLWEATFNNANSCDDVPQEQLAAYNAVVSETAAFKLQKIRELVALGHLIHTVQITGEAPNGVDHYAIDRLAEKQFGNRVVGDSEYSALFILTTEADQDEVLAFVKETAGSGRVTYNDGFANESRFYITEIEPHIPELSNWPEARKFLAIHS